MTNRKERGMIRVVQLRNKCIGCAYCVGVAPEFWRMNAEDGRCDLIGATNRKGQYVLSIFEDDIPKIQKSAALCPSKCIRLEFTNQ